LAVDLIALKNEINTDPTGRGYSGKTHTEVANLLNEAQVSIQINRGVIETRIAQEQVIISEFESLSAGKQRAWLALISPSEVDVDNSNIRNQTTDIWGVGTTTRSNLQVLLTRNGSRAEELFGRGTNIARIVVERARNL